MIRRLLADVLVVALAAGLAGFGGGLFAESHRPPAAVTTWA